MGKRLALSVVLVMVLLMVMMVGSSSVATAAKAKVIFEEEFSTFDSAKWVAATYLPNYTGVPQTISQTTVDGRDVIYMETNEVGNWHRRGIGSTTSIPLISYRTTVVEMAFEPLGDLDGMAELWLFDQSTSKFARFLAYSGVWGAHKTLAAEISGYDVRVSQDDLPAFAWNEWCTFRIECNPTTTVFSFLDVNRNVTWSTTFDVALSSLFQNCNVAVSQVLGTPGSGTWTMKANIDYVKVTSSVPKKVPTPKGRLLFREDFVTYSSAKWVDASCLPFYSGVPQVITKGRVDMKSVIYMETTVSGSHMRRGILSTKSIPLVSGKTTIAEMAFKPMGDIDMMAELWLFDPSTSDYAYLAAKSGNFGANKEAFAQVSGYAVTYSSTPIYSWGEWLILRVEANPTDTVFYLLDANRNVRWSMTYNVALYSLFQNFNIAISQGVDTPGSGSWTMKAYIDYVTVTRG